MIKDSKKIERPRKDRSGKMSQLRAQEQLYLIRHETLRKRLQSVKELIVDNRKKLVKVKQAIKVIVYE